MCLHFINIGQPASSGTTTSRSSLSDESLTSKYAIALKTKSFDQFYQEVQTAITHTLSDSPCNCNSNSNSNSSNFLGELLFLDEEYVNTHILQHYINKPELHTLLSCYFASTQNAFQLCALLLKSTYGTRMSYTGIQHVLDLTASTPNFDCNQQECHRISAEFIMFIEQENPFVQAALFEGMCDCLEELRQKLELSRQKKVKMGWVGEKIFPQLGKQTAQLDAAGRGIYVLKNHLETTRMLVTRLYNEVEHNKSIMRICHGRKYEPYPLQQVVKLLGKNDSHFRRRLDEIEEQGCLCLLNINRARTLLLQQIHQ